MSQVAPLIIPRTSRVKVSSDSIPRMIPIILLLALLQATKTLGGAVTSYEHAPHLEWVHMIVSIPNTSTCVLLKIYKFWDRPKGHNSPWKRPSENPAGWGSGNDRS